MSIWYFAYGSNMKQLRLESRIKRTGLVWKRGFIQGHSICFDKIAGDGSGYANLKVDNAGKVWGILYELTDNEIEILDTKEGVSKHYLRNKTTRRNITTDDGIFSCEVYFANTAMINNNLLPRRDYLNFLIEGAVEHQLPEDYILVLKGFNTFD